MTDRFLVCAPDHFGVSYVINPWMQGQIGRINARAACRQWNRLAELLGQLAQVERIAQQPGVPDMVFTANAGLVVGNRFVPSRFRHPQRRPEEEYFTQWFAQQGFEICALDPDLSFEGAGDALLDRGMPLLWVGHGQRSDQRCADCLIKLLGLEVQPLQLVDDRFYHLDTCFCPLDGGYLMYYPAAFAQESLERIATRVPASHRIEVSRTDGLSFACNAVNCGRHIILNRATPSLVARLAAHGFIVQQTPLTEFIKAGGAAKCLTLRLNEACGAITQWAA